MTKQMPTTKGQLAVARAYSKRDIVVLVITFIVVFLASCGYLLFQYFADDSYKKDYEGIPIIGGVAAFLVISMLFLGVSLVLGMIITRIQRQTVLGNSLEVEYSDFAWLRDWANEVSRDLEMPRVELFVTQDPMINAYAFGFARPYTIVLHSGSIRYLTPDELKAVTVHEMAHVKYGHTAASVYLLPFLSVPLVGAIFGYLCGFWQRRTELTADRLALMYMHDAELVKSALIKVHVGPDVASSMNDVARQWLQYKAERPMNRFAQTFSSHPFLVRRLSHLDRWKYVIEQDAQFADQLPESAPTA